MARPFGTGGVVPSPSTSRAREGFPWRLAAVVVFVACFSLYAWQTLIAGRPVGGGLLLLPVLFMLTAPAFVRASRSESTFDLAGLMATGLALRCAAAYFRWVNGADAHVYHQVGAELARSFRSLHFSVDVGREVPGTGALRYIAGLVSVPTNSDEFLTFLVFTWFGFWGCVLFYRAFVTALPGADRSRYAKLIFLWPSLAFWPSSIGKESWIMLTLGLAMLGAARVLVRRRGGYSLLTAGLAGMTLVRPHVALLAVVAFGVAFLVGRRDDSRAGVVTPTSVAKAVGIVMLLLVGGVLATKTVAFLKIDDLSGSSVDTALQSVRERSAEGESQYESPNPGTPGGYVTAFVTTIARPLPTEAHGFEQLATSAEGLVLFGFLLTSRRRLASVPRRLRREPYITFALAYLLMFVYAFSAISNFGILARQRVQVLPFVFVLLAVPAVGAARQRDLRTPPVPS